MIRRVPLLALLLALLLLTGCAPARHWEAGLVLADIAAGEAPTRLKTQTEPPRRDLVRYTVAGRERSADLYVPTDGAPRAAIVLVPGAVPQAKDEPRIVAFANTLARAQFAVLVPEIPGFRQLRMHHSDARVVADAFVWLAARKDLAPAGRVGLAAFSYGLGPAVLAALEADVLAAGPRFVVGVGGYYDMTRAIRYFTTGYFEVDGARQHLRPDDYGKLVLAHSALPYLPAADAALLRAMAERRLRDRTADVGELAGGLSPPGRAVFEVIENRDPDAFAARYAALPPQLRADLAALSLHDKDLSVIPARFILLHGRNDNLIPWPESVALAAALPESQARVYLLEAVLGHVDITLSHLLSWQFLRHELPDIVRMWRAVDALLAERDAAG